MKATFRWSVAASLVMVIGVAILQAAPPDAVVSINGHGLWARSTGDEYSNHQPYIESTMVNAWLDAEGQGHGTIVWMDVYNGLFDAQGDDHGESVSGYTWQVEVDTVSVLSANEVYVEGVITHSNVEGDIGNRNGFYIRDGGAASPDFILSYFPSEYDIALPVLAGHFTIR